MRHNLWTTPNNANAFKIFEPKCPFKGEDILKSFQYWGQTRLGRKFWKAGLLNGQTKIQNNLFKEYLKFWFKDCLARRWKKLPGTTDREHQLFHHHHYIGLKLGHQVLLVFSSARVTSKKSQQGVIWTLGIPGFDVILAQLFMKHCLLIKVLVALGLHFSCPNEISFGFIILQRN